MNTQLNTPHTLNKSRLIRWLTLLITLLTISLWLTQPAHAEPTNGQTGNTAGISQPASTPVVIPPFATQDPQRTYKLEQANQALLTDNAALKQQIDSLSTQVNVLVNERSGQLFMYGVTTTVVAFIAGLFLGFIIFARNKNRW